MVIHPRYIFGVIEPSAYETYKAKNQVRARLSYKAMSEMMISNSLVRIKDAPPYTKDLEASVLMNSMARTIYDPKTGSYVYSQKHLTTKPSLDIANASAVSEIVAHQAVSGVGVDQGMRLLLNDLRRRCIKLYFRIDLCCPFLKSHLRRSQLH